MASKRAFDAVFVGSGINSLVGAALLAQRGWRVGVLECEDRLGGAIHGVRFANTTRPWGVLGEDERSLVMTTDHAQNVREFERLRPGAGRAWDTAIGTVLADAGDLFGIRSVYLWSPAGLRWALGLLRRRGPAGTRALLAETLMPARAWLTQTFEEPLFHALLAPWTLHGGGGPDEAGSALLLRAMTAFTESGGTPLPVGGGGRVVDALVEIIEEHGGSCLTGVNVEQVLVERGRATGVATTGGTYRGERAVVCNVTPGQLYERLLDPAHVPADLRESVARWRPGLPVFQLHFSLSRRLAWKADRELADVANINITAGLDAVSRAVNEAMRGLLPVEPNLSLVQPMVVDPSRGPEGTWQLYIQIGEIPSRLRGDAAGEIDISGGWTTEVREAFADRLQAILARHLPGLDEAVLERIALSPRDLEEGNVNLVGGSPNAGAAELDQMLPGLPLADAPSPATPVRDLFQIGASTHPGPSLAGLSGFLIAERLGRGSLRSRTGQAARSRLGAGRGRPG